MYVLEAYSAAWAHLEAGSELRKRALAQMTVGLGWMTENRVSGRTGGNWDCNSQWGSKFGGLPFHVYVYARHNPDGKKEIAAADRELAAVSEVLGRDRPPRLSQLRVFAMMSYAEAPPRLALPYIKRKLSHFPGNCDIMCGYRIQDKKIYTRIPDPRIPDRPRRRIAFKKSA